MKPTDQQQGQISRAELFAVDEGAVNAVLSRLDDLPAMPLTAAEILRLTKSPEVEIKQIEKVINSDPALAAKVLRIANSAFYGLKIPVSTLSHALMVLGLYQLRSVVVAAAYRGLYSKVPIAVEGILADIWRHSFVTGFVAREIGKAGGLAQHEECFVAGLLHDIGQVVLARRFPDDFARLCKEANETGIEKRSIEKSRWGIDHTMVGATVLDRWKIAPGLASYVRFHHEPLIAPEEDRKFCAALFLADRFERGALDTIEKLGAGENPKVLALLGFTAESFQQLTVSLKEKIAAEANSVQEL